MGDGYKRPADAYTYKRPTDGAIVNLLQKFAIMVRLQITLQIITDYDYRYEI